MLNTLYYARGTCSLASMAALELAGLPYEAREIVLAESRTALWELTGEGRVPVLVTANGVVVETVAILWWIAAASDGRGLLPTGAAAADALSIMAWLTSRVHILRRQVYRPNTFIADKEAQAQLREAALPAYRRELEKLDRLIAEGRFRAPTLQCYALVFHYWARTDGIDGLPHLAALADDMCEHPGIARAITAHGHNVHHQ